MHRPAQGEALMPACSTEVDIAALVYEATSQIPRGMVSTYGDIASALGDKVAARAVGEILCHNPTPIVVPCHRIVYSDGSVGWYDGYGKGRERKVQLLHSEGVEVDGERVASFDAIRFRGFRIPPVLKQLRQEQELVRERIADRDDFGKLRRVAGLDVSYEGQRAFSAIAIYDWESGELVEERTMESTVKFPYIPTYLTFREMPALRPLIRPEDGTVYLIDGQGVLHPRGAGIASHIGTCLGIPTVGAAKSLLVGKVERPEAESSPIILDGQVAGHMLREGKKATYVSVGTGVSLGTATEICSQLLDRGIPKPLRRAHDLANKARKDAPA